MIRAGFEHPAVSALDAGVVSSTGPWSAAALNLSPRPGDLAGNLIVAETAIAGAKRARPDLRWFVLPELFTCGYSRLGHIHRYAENAVEGPSVRRLSALAESLGVYVAYGFPELLPGSKSRVFDSANLVGPDGLLMTYRKRHLVRDTGENLVFEPGGELPAVEAGGLRVTLAICWDLGFPETVREAALEGAELVLAPAAWRAPYGTQYDLACASRALDNGIYLASANQSGAYPEASFDMPGGVYGPDGTRTSESFGDVSVGRIDPGASARWRDLYGNTMPPASYLEAVVKTGEPA